MKRIHLLKSSILLLFLSVLPLIASDSLKVLTYNIEGMKPGTTPDIRITNMVQKLYEINPDILCLQEINSLLNETKNQGRQIADSLAAHFHNQYYYYQSFTHLSWDNQYREYIGIISKFRIQTQGSKQLPPGAFPRRVVWNYLTTPLGMINIFTTHLSYNSSSVRIQQVQSIKNYIAAEEVNHSSIATILTGDFNDTPNAQSILALTNTNNDSFYFDTFHNINPNLSGNTIPANAPTSRIDYVFYKNNGLLNMSSSSVVMNQPYSGNNYCSDHRGVLTVFSQNTTGIIETGKKKTSKTAMLHQNFPNPFNPSATISYKIRNSDFVKLNIFDMLGNKVKTLINKYQPVGLYSAIQSQNFCNTD